MPRSIYQTGPSPKRQLQSPFRGRGGSSGSSGGGGFRNNWGTGGNEGNFAGFEFDRWQALQRAGKDPSQFAQGVEDRFRAERRGIEDRQSAESRRRWDLDRHDRRFADIRRRARQRRLDREAKHRAPGGKWHQPERRSWQQPERRS